MAENKKSFGSRIGSILRTILYALAFAFAVGFVIGTLIRREAEKPIRYMGDRTGEDIGRPIDGGGPGAGTGLRFGPQHPGHIAHTESLILVTRHHEEQIG